VSCVGACTLVFASQMSVSFSEMRGCMHTCVFFADVGFIRELRGCIHTRVHSAMRFAFVQELCARCEDVVRGNREFKRVIQSRLTP
jgi:hypothetical protein